MRDLAVKKRLVTDALIIFVLTGFGYLVAFCYEFGYCHYLRIPTELITITTTRIITSTILVGAFIVALGRFASPYYEYLSSDNIVTHYIGKYTLTFVFLVFAYWAFGNFSLVTPLLILVLMRLYADLIYPLTYKKNTIGYLNKLKAYRAERTNPKVRSIWLDGRIRGALNNNFGLMLAVVCVAAFYSLGVGRNTAKDQEIFLVIKSKRVLVLRQYGSSFVGVTIDQKNVVSGIYLIEKSNIENYGPLMIEKMSH